MLNTQEKSQIIGVKDSQVLTIKEESSFPVPFLLYSMTETSIQICHKLVILLQFKKNKENSDFPLSTIPGHNFSVLSHNPFIYIYIDTH